MNMLDNYDDIDCPIAYKATGEGSSADSNDNDDDGIVGTNVNRVDDGHPHLNESLHYPSSFAAGTKPGEANGNVAVSVHLQRTQRRCQYWL